LNNFTTKFNLILNAEGLTPTKFSRIAGITQVAASDYKINRSTPSASNLFKIIQAFPCYTCYIFDLDPKNLPNQIIFKD
jgi:transcriptional regulator with XRE-family HTH domain